MEPEMLYFLTVSAAVILAILPLLHIRSIHDHHMYNFRNIIVSAICPFMLVLIVSLLADFDERGAFTLSSLLVNFPPRFANLSIGLIFLLFVYMAVSNAVLILHEGMAIRNTVGTVLELIFIFATLAVYVLACFLETRSSAMTGFSRFLCRWFPYFLYCMVDYGECMMLGIMMMGWVAAHGKSAHDKDFIIIPGCSISRTGGLLPLLRGRVDRAVHYAWEQEIATGKPVYYIPSGGQGADEIMSEGSAMELYLLCHSAEQSEIFAEKKSKNTAENFLFSAEIVKNKNPDAKVAFATTNYHVLRCGMLAKRAGLIAEGLACSTKWYFWPNGFAREVVAILNMTKVYHAIAIGLMFVASLLITLLI